MSSGAVIEVDRISKQYRLGTIGSSTVMKDISLFWSGLTGNRKNIETENESIWALKDISFEVKQGEVLGIIGKNGAGKSTLLKILSQITQPTSGEIRIRGKMASLLEVGTGFHQELSGRENIFLNGAILGMSRNEIKQKFDEIVDFSGVEKFIDTPVKRYSSGMYVRLAFAVAAHLQPDILVVDEVLAVGDAEFQKKCLGKMKDVSGQGRTVLFVSHNMTAVKNLCKKCILLENGTIHATGATDEVVDIYQELNLKNDQIPIKDRQDRSGNGNFKFTDFEVISGNGQVKTGGGLKIRIHFKINKEKAPLKNTAISFSINTLEGNYVLVFFTEEQNKNIPLLINDGYIDCEVNEFPLTSGTYTINLYATVNGILADNIANACNMIVDDSHYYLDGRSKHRNHPVYVVKHQWSYKI